MLIIITVHTSCEPGTDFEPTYPIWWDSAFHPRLKWTDKFSNFTTVIFYCYLNAKPHVNKYINFLALHQHMNLIHYCKK